MTHIGVVFDNELVLVNERNDINRDLNTESLLMLLAKDPSVQIPTNDWFERHVIYHRASFDKLREFVSDKEIWDLIHQFRDFDTRVQEVPEVIHINEIVEEQRTVVESQNERVIHAQLAIDEFAKINARQIDRMKHLYRRVLDFATEPHLIDVLRGTVYLLSDMHMARLFKMYVRDHKPFTAFSDHHNVPTDVDFWDQRDLFDMFSFVSQAPGLVAPLKVTRASVVPYAASIGSFIREYNIGDIIVPWTNQLISVSHDPDCILFGGICFHINLPVGTPCIPLAMQGPHPVNNRLEYEWILPPLSRFQVDAIYFDHVQLTYAGPFVPVEPVADIQALKTEMFALIERWCFRKLKHQPQLMELERLELLWGQEKDLYAQILHEFSVLVKERDSIVTKHTRILTQHLNDIVVGWVQDAESGRRRSKRLRHQ